MDGTGFHFTPNSRVRLRNTVDPAVYGDFACTGNEGWIADRRTDHYGLPEVLIKWDKNHWAYNGVSDCWTFEEHFELVEDNMDRKEAAQQAALEFASRMASIFDTDSDPEPDKPSPVDDLTSRLAGAGRPFQSQLVDPYAEAVETAAQRLADSEGFVVIGMSRNQNDLLEPFALAFSKTPKAELAVQAHMAGVAARAHQELALSLISQQHDKDGV